MPQTVGANVARAARIADAYATAESNSRATVKLSATAKWHQDQSIRTLSKSLARQRDKQACGPRPRPPAPPSRAALPHHPRGSARTVRRVPPRLPAQCFQRHAAPAGRGVPDPRRCGCRIEEEQQMASKEMLARRSQRMKELYEAETAQLLRELEDMGLQISK